MKDLPHQIDLYLPEWIQDFLRNQPDFFPGSEERMNFVLSLTDRQIEKGSGGPFGAAVFELESGKLISVGVNRVVATGCSTAHAEVMALSLAQKAVGTHDLGAEELPEFQIVVNAQMCAMCLGAVIWSGVREVCYAATSQEVEQITGFDEGPLPSNIKGVLRQRGIRLKEGIMVEESKRLLEKYMATGGLVYNATRTHKVK